MANYWSTNKGDDNDLIKEDNLKNEELQKTFKRLQKWRQVLEMDIYPNPKER